MTVRQVQAFPVAYPEPNDHDRKRSVCLIKITDDEGVSGWGEACTYFPEATLAVARLVDGVSELLIGRDPLHNIAIWRDLRDHAWWYGTGAGLASMALSGLDIALWDLKGRISGTSLVEMLGGPAHSRLPAVASVHGTKANINEMVDDFSGHLEGGLHGIKVGFGKRGDARLGFESARDLEFVRAMRNAIGDKLLMVDLGVNNFWDVPTAIARARAFEEHGVHWLEEPLGHDDPEGYRALRAGSGIRIAYGEREWNARGVQRIVESGTVDVVGLDPGRVEGITGFHRAAQICEMYRRQANAHNFSTAIVGAASAALSWANPSCRILELQPVYGIAQRDLVDRPVWHEDGYVPMPARPGLGIEVDENLVRSNLIGV